MTINAKDAKFCSFHSLVPEKKKRLKNRIREMDRKRSKYSLSLRR